METKGKKTPLIILATYWNERYFIEPSLRQIEALNPSEIIIADGCFNPRVSNYSTDGTREIIEKVIATRPNARMIPALRPGIFKAAWLLLRGHKHLPWWTIFRLSRWKFLLVSLMRVPYQRNEGITFQHMISVSKEWKPGFWFTSYDADQFYSDEMIKEMARIMDNNPENIDLMTATEMTFFKDFSHYTTSIVKRISSNMPNRIYPDTTIQPQRSIIRETKSGEMRGLRDILAKHLYVRFVKQKNVGFYFHYKLNPPSRLNAGYQVGNRGRPNPEHYEMKEFTGKHPRVAREYFGL